jgi:hypothetical protein
MDAEDAVAVDAIDDKHRSFELSIEGEQKLVLRCSLRAQRPAS